MITLREVFVQARTSREPSQVAEKPIHPPCWKGETSELGRSISFK